MTADTLATKQTPSTGFPSQSPYYYRHISGVDCRNISIYLSPCLARAFEFVWRCDNKGDAIVDLNKALERLKMEQSICAHDCHVVDRDIKQRLKSLIGTVCKAEKDNLKSFALRCIASACFSNDSARIEYIKEAIININEMIKYRKI